MDTIPGFNLWYQKLKSMSQPLMHPTIANQPKILGETYGVTRITNKISVTEDTMDIAYETRYGLSYQEVLPFFEQIAKMNLEDYPFNYASTVVQRAVEVDYQVERMFF